MTANYAWPLANTINFPFRDVWSISDCQRGLLTSTTVSPSGIWVVSASQNGSMHFLDYKSGSLVGVLDLESHFYATAAVWRSDTTLVFSCSNGIVYHLDLEPKSKSPISVHALLKPLRSPIRCIAFDPFCDMLAIGCDGEVRIYVRAIHTSTESWDCVDHILAPCTGSSSLVTALCFFGTSLTSRHLFIGHTKAGWIIWTSPRIYHRTPLMDGKKVCTIGSATVPPSERFIAISTLDNSLITYSLGEGGPNIDTQAEADFPKLTKYCPMLPIVSTSSDLVLKSTSVGAIEVLDPRSRSTASLHHTHNHIIRTLNAYGDRVVVGSSDMTDNPASSCLRCYTFSSAAEPRDWRRIDEFNGPVFKITLSDILPFSDRMVLYNPFRLFDIVRAIRLNLRGNQETALILVCFGVFFFVLALDPPSRTSPVSSTDIQLSSGRYPSEPLSRKPTLSTLIWWCTSNIANRLSAWFIWLSQTTGWIAKIGGIGVSTGQFIRLDHRTTGLKGLFLVKYVFFALNLLMRVVLLVPRLLKDALVKVPDVLAGFICEMLRLHGFDDICPE